MPPIFNGGSSEVQISVFVMEVAGIHDKDSFGYYTKLTLILYGASPSNCFVGIHCFHI